jgi:hypothetical protein
MTNDQTCQRMLEMAGLHIPKPGNEARRLLLLLVMKVSPSAAKNGFRIFFMVRQTRR